MNTPIKRACGLVMAATLLLGATLPAAAAASAQKEEVVYVKLSHDGRVDSIYVVNSFDATAPGEITDLGAYSEVRNLTTTDPIRNQGGAVRMTVPRGRFYYEGTLERRDIPWAVDINYWLDGKPISGDALAGRSGRLQIDFSVRHRPGANETYLDNYAIQATLSLDTERCAGIEAEGATVANVGKNKQLSYIILPGKEGAYTVTADVTDFEMDGISINGIPMSLDIDDPDTDEIKEKIEELQDGAVELDDGARELDDGARELDDGARELDDGATKLDDGVLTLEDGVTELEDGAEELRDGAHDLRDGAHDLYNGAKDLRDGVEELDGGVSKLSSGAATFGTGLSELHAQSEELVEGSARVLGSLQQLEGMVGAGDSAPVRQPSDYLQESSRQYRDTLDDMIADYRDQLSDLRGEDDEDSELQIAVLESNLDLLRALRDEYAGVESGISQLTDEPRPRDEADSADPLLSGVQELVRQYEVLDQSIGRYTGGVDRLNSSYGELTTGIADLTDGVDELLDGAKELRSGARELYDGTYDLQDGVSRLTDGVGELRDGATELRDGTLELKDGTLELVDGTLELVDGTLEMLDGTTELREKTADMDGEIDDRIDELLEEYRGKDFEPVSFVDERNTVNKVQFVMLTEKIAVDDDLLPDAQAQPEPEPLTLWQRFLNLFSFLRREKE